MRIQHALLRTGLLSLAVSTLSYSFAPRPAGAAVTPPAPSVTVSPGTLSFGNENIGTVSAARVIKISNNGSTAAPLAQISITGDFHETSACTNPLPARSSCVINVQFAPTAAGARTGTVIVASGTSEALPHIVVSGNGVTPPPVSHLSAVWANEGGDKVTQDELRASKHLENLTGKVINRAWNGKSILLAGARNEVVSFNLILEAATANASQVSVSFDTLTGPSGATIHSTKAAGNQVFDWTARPIELFFVRYLPIHGLSVFGYNKWDERQIPVRFQRPWTGDGVASGVWTDRPDHDKLYPDPLVPLELNPMFPIAAGQNQSVWCDIYIPKNVPAGIYQGSVTVEESGAATHTVPVSLTVHNFVLPDQPSAKTMAVLSTNDILHRYVTTGNYADWNSPQGVEAAQITDRYYELFHRHKIALIGENDCPITDHPCDTTVPRLNGSLYSASNGYDGPGANTAEGVFSIGTYGTWGQGSYGIAPWRNDQGLFVSHLDNWANWFQQNSPNTDYFLYLEDEPPAQDYAQVETWAKWIKQDSGPGKSVLSFSTIQPVFAKSAIPDLAVPTMPASLGTCPLGQATCSDNETINQAAADFYSKTAGRKLWAYNDGRPAVGSSMTEDDGIAMRTLAWAQYKKHIDRWYYWYVNPDPSGDWFTNPVTWGTPQFYDPVLGVTGNDGTSNGNGLMVYPGTDLYNPQDSYNVGGPIASLRLKEWRRGIQDADYLALADQINPQAVAQIVSQTLPQTLWEYPTADPNYYTGGGPSWSSDPDVWEAKRAALSQIISNYCTKNPTSKGCN